MTVEEKTFESIYKLNEFLIDNRVEIISIIPVKEMVNSGLPLPNYQTFFYEKEFLRVFFHQSQRK